MDIFLATSVLDPHLSHLISTQGLCEIGIIIQVLHKEMNWHIHSHITRRKDSQD